MEAEVVSKPTKDLAFTAVFALLVTTIACAVVVLATPRALMPDELPVLVLDRGEVARALAADVVLAATAPGGVDVDELAERYLDEGRAEHATAVEQRLIQQRQRAWQQLVQGVFARIGIAGIKGLRAQTLLHFMRAWRGEIADAAETEGLLGSLPEVLHTYGVTAADRSLLAPELCLRVNFKARWNLIHGLPVSSDFSRIESQAFEGWIALHANAAPDDRRLRAARTFHEAGGHRSAQALATWLYRVGHPADAVVLMKRERDARRELFTRNYGLGLAAAAL